MSLYIQQTVETQTGVTPQVVITNELLTLQSADLEQTVAEHVEENPVLEMIEHERCPVCGSPARGNLCPYCGNGRLAPRKDPEHEGWNIQDYSTYNWDDEAADPIARIADGPSLGEYLSQQLSSLLEPDDLPMTLYLIDSLDSHGFLSPAIAPEVAARFHTTLQHVETIIEQIQELEPLGIGARSPQEALLIQLRHLRSEGTDHPLAEAIISKWDSFLKSPRAALAKEMGVTEEEIDDAYEFITNNLNPYPAHAHWSLGEAKPRPDAIYVRPDIAIHRRPAPADGFEVEVLSARAFTVRIDPTYARLAEELEGNGNASSEEARQQLKEYMARGKLFIRCLSQRWQTLQQIGDFLINYQRGFLEHGEKAIRPITRAELADLIGVHESTVSRAVANKYVLLPDKRVIPMSDFFDDSLAVKEVLKELIRNETSPMSDQQLADILKTMGYDIARRTVAKYRQEMEILPARLRSR